MPEVVAPEIKVEQHQPTRPAAEGAYEAATADGRAPVAGAVVLHAYYTLHLVTLPVILHIQMQGSIYAALSMSTSPAAPSVTAHGPKTMDRIGSFKSLVEAPFTTA